MWSMSSPSGACIDTSTVRSPTLTKRLTPSSLRPKAITVPPSINSAPRFSESVSWVRSAGLFTRGTLPRFGRLEELDGIAGGIVEHDLAAARSADDLVAEPHARRAQPLDLGVD